MSEHQPKMSLSPAGKARREAMLGDLVDTMVRIRYRRRAVRIGGAGAILVAAAVTVVSLAGRGPGSPTPELATGENAATQLEGTTTAILVERVGTDNGILSRYATGTKASRVERLTDDQLLATLSEMNRPTGLIRTSTETRLTANVTDDRPESLFDDSHAPRPLEELFAIASQ